MPQKLNLRYRRDQQNSQERIGDKYSQGYGLSNECVVISLSHHPFKAIANRELDIDKTMALGQGDP